jgi:predicted glycoside hydrolase/deacetylase ChbG (UPF0249 family)
MSKSLIVNADDYGRTPGVSAGIREAHLYGIVSSASVMLNMPAVGEDLQLALRDCPRLGLGVHLVLTSGTPLLPSEKVPSLTAGKAVFPGQEEQIARLHDLHPAQVHAEWQAQVEQFIAFTGRAPDHFDLHHHISYLSAPLLRIMLEFSRKYGCPIRLPRVTQGGEALSGLPDGLILNIQTFTARLLKEFAPRHPDAFYGSFYDHEATREVLMQLLSSLPEGSTELMCHPGYADASLLSGSSYSRQRERELALLTNPEIIALIEQQGIQLITYSQL